MAEEMEMKQQSHTGHSINQSIVYPETTYHLLNFSAYSSEANYRDESMIGTYNLSPNLSSNNSTINDHVNDSLCNSLNGSYLNENNIHSNGITSSITGSNQRRGSLQLWQFLVALLDNSNPSTGCITWTGKGLEVSCHILICNGVPQNIFVIFKFPFNTVFALKIYFLVHFEYIG